MIEFIASKFDQNIRELEGALVRVVAWCDLTGHPIDTELAEQALEDLLPQTEAEIPPPLILEETARYFGLSVDDLVSQSRSRPLTHARHVAMYLMRECTGLSLVKIGEIFGGRDHTTVLHGINKVEKDMRARDAGVPAGPGPLPHHPGPRSGGRMSLWRTRGPAVGCGARDPSDRGRGGHVLPSPSTCRRRPLRWENGCLPTFPQPLLLLSCRRT